MKTNLFSFKKSSPLLNKPVFLARLAQLLREGYSFPDALNLILPHHTKDYQSLLAAIDEDFRKGLGIHEILSRLHFSPHILLPISIAENNGQLPEVLEGAANRLKKNEAIEKRMKNLLSYPIVLFLFVSSLLVAYRKFLLPNMNALATSRTSIDKGLSAYLPVIVSRIPDFIFGIGLVLTIVIVICVVIYKKRPPSRKIEFVGKMPIISEFFYMRKTQIFTGEIGSLLQSGISMQDALDVLMKQEIDPVLGEIAKVIQEHVIYGEPFHEAIRLTSGLTKECSDFAEHGAASGHLAKELLIYSDHLEETIHMKLGKGLSLLQPLLFSVIAICILAAYIALLLPVYGMLDQI